MFVPLSGSALVGVSLIVALTGASRIAIQEQELAPKVADPATCKTFEEEFDAPQNSCLSLVRDASKRAILAGRAKDLLFEMLQTQRYLTDKLTPDSGTLAKMWHGSKLGSPRASRRFLQGAMIHIPEVVEFLERPAKEKAGELPAGAMPLVVEVKDRSMTGATFCGEAGVPLVIGVQEYNLTLQPNPRRGYLTPQGNVQVTTDVRMTSPKDCESIDHLDAGLRCVDIAVKVVCKSATGIMKTRSPYCKLRFKRNGLTHSSEDKTGIATENRENPVFPTQVFQYEWEEMLFTKVRTAEEMGREPTPPESTYVPWILDELTVGEQSHANLYYLSKFVFTNEEKCKNSRVKGACEIIERFGRLTIDKKTLDKISDPTPEGIAQAFDGNTLEYSEPDAPSGDNAPPESLAQVSRQSMVGAVGAIVGAQHRNRQRGGRVAVGESKEMGPMTYVCLVGLFVMVLLVLA